MAGSLHPLYPIQTLVLYFFPLRIQLLLFIYSVFCAALALQAEMSGPSHTSAPVPHVATLNDSDFGKFSFWMSSASFDL